MAAPENKYAFDLDVAVAAAELWEKYGAERKYAQDCIKKGKYTDAESPERLTKRLNRLLAHVRGQLPGRANQKLQFSEGLTEALSQANTLTVDNVNDAFVERVLGETRDFLSVGFLENAWRAVRSVGRIVTDLGNGRRAFGTGFLVSPRLLLTNHHVLPRREAAARSVVEFDYQVDQSGQALTVQSYLLEPATFFLNDEALDFALVAVQPSSRLGQSLRAYGWCPLIAEEGKIILGDPVNIIQHPRGEMKQVVLRENKLLFLPEQGPYAQYVADTEPGSSGSPVFNDQWEVVALHHSSIPKRDSQGRFLDIDDRVWVKDRDDPARLAWSANEGIRVSRLMAAIQAAQLQTHEEALRAELLSARPPVDPPEERRTTPSPVTPSPNGEHNMGTSVQQPTGTITLTIPLHITISLGEAVGPGAASVVATPPTENLEAIRPAPDYENRPGFDTNFLGLPVPLPKLSNTIRSQAAEVPGAPAANRFELKYYHSSILFNKQRKLAFVAAVNLDAGAPFKHRRDGSDRWFFDPRLSTSIQTGEDAYARNPLDRGHLVRRDDAAWGRTAAEAKLANDDTFHFTNCSPQHEIFNQSGLATARSLELWGNLENHVTAQAQVNGKKVCVFNGPVFRNDDTMYRSIVRLPREFFKVIVYRKPNGQLGVVSFILSQQSLIRNLPTEDFQVGPFQPFQVKLREIERRTNLQFGTLTALDPLESAEHESAFEADTEAVALESLDRVIMA